MRFVFFGTAPLAIACLDALGNAGLTPSLVVAGQDRLARDRSIIFPPEKQWALARNITVLQPKEISVELLGTLRAQESDVFVAASYGKILPKALLDLPKRGVVNMHPSLLPRLRGPSPIRSAILNDEKQTGVSIMLLDDQMDHGPLIGQKTVSMTERPMHGFELDTVLANEGAPLLAEVLPKWVAGEIEPKSQDHSNATYCKIFLKEDGEIDLDDDAATNLRKIRAFEGWPGTFAFFLRGDQKIRALILDAHLEGTRLVIDMVKPEGKKEMSYGEFLRSGARPA